MKKLTKKQLEIYNWLLDHPGYLKKSSENLWKYCKRFRGYLIKDLEIALREAKKYYKTISNDYEKVEGNIIKSLKFKEKKALNKALEDINKQKGIYLSSTPLKKLLKPKKSNVYGMDPRNVLVIGDTHFPFDKDGYLDHCLDMQKKYNCGTIIHIGDVADNCYSSFHESNPDGMGAGDELEAAIKKLKDWYKAFPKVLITTGNHCQIIQRKAFTSGLSKKWIRGLNEVLEVPNWQFELEYELNNVLYTHGTGTSGDKAAFNKALNRRKSVVQGHLHSQASIMWNTSSIDRIFAMQVGCGVDESKYAFDYAKNFSKKFIVSCGLVLENGTLPLIEPMKL